MHPKRHRRNTQATPLERVETQGMMISSAPAQRALSIPLLLAAAVFFGLHFAHLAADFPNNSPWMDWSKYTDEGWYGDAAIRHFQLGHWYVPGDFNPAAALPVWPIAEGLVFHFSGVSLAAARALTVAVFGGILIAGWWLVSRRHRGASSPLSASVAVLLLTVSPFCFVFTRLAITEPLLIFLTLLALLAARQVSVIEPPARMFSMQWEGQFVRSNLVPILSLGLLLPLMVLTKTTALFLTPAVFWMLWSACGYRSAVFVRLASAAGVLAAALWLAYYGLVVRPHFLADYRYLFTANAYTGMTRTTAVAVLASTLHDGIWMGAVFYPLAVAAGVLALVQFRRSATHPLIPVLLIWVAGYLAFLAYHNNLQPRYYLVVAVPLTLLLPVVVEDLVLARLGSSFSLRLGLTIAGIAVFAIAVPDAVETINFVRHPQYTLVNAAQQVERFIDSDRQRDPGHNRLILSISGSDLSLMTGLPSICDDFGTLELIDRVRRYHPGWYVAWNQVEDDKMDALAPFFRLDRVAAFPAMDDPDRNLLIVYRLDDGTGPQPARRNLPPVTKHPRSRLGQEPSTQQQIH